MRKMSYLVIIERMILPKNSRGINTMTTLTGTEKQIAWANDIRAKMIESLKTFRAEWLNAYRNNTEAQDKVNSQCDEIETVFASMTETKDAKWFIDYRDCDWNIRHSRLWPVIVAEVQKARSAK